MYAQIMVKVGHLRPTPMFAGQGRFDAFVREFNAERPHEALAGSRWRAFR